MKALPCTPAFRPEGHHHLATVGGDGHRVRHTARGDRGQEEYRRQPQKGANPGSNSAHQTTHAAEFAGPPKTNIVNHGLPLPAASTCPRRPCIPTTTGLLGDCTEDSEIRNNLPPNSIRLANLVIKPCQQLGRTADVRHAPAVAQDPRAFRSGCCALTGIPPTLPHLCRGLSSFGPIGHGPTETASSRNRRRPGQRPGNGTSP